MEWISILLIALILTGTYVGSKRLPASWRLAIAAPLALYVGYALFARGETFPLIVFAGALALGSVQMLRQRQAPRVE
ncbi:MAG: hypothetical protein AAFQ53_06270 [Bacteroidota bacterium]